jgi:RHS repeat-associated protein
MTSEVRERGRYTGQEYDWPLTDAYNLRAREYYPEYGRFMQEDPIGDQGGSLNWYSYTNSNPVNWTDPTGLKCCENPEEVKNRIKFIRNILREIYKGNIDADNYSSQGTPAANTWCIPILGGGIPYTEYYYKGDKCIEDCLHIHEKIHRSSCRKNGYTDFNEEYAAYLAELVCLINKLQGN